MSCMALCWTFTLHLNRNREEWVIYPFCKTWNCFRWCVSIVFQWFSAVQSWSQTPPVWKFLNIGLCPCPGHSQCDYTVTACTYSTGIWGCGGVGEERPGHEGGVHGGPHGEGAAAAHDAAVPRRPSGAGGTHQDVAQMQVTSSSRKVCPVSWSGKGVVGPCVSSEGYQMSLAGAGIG